MEINFSMNVVAADAAKREITGRVVTWGEKGYTSAGETVFEPNSIKFGGKTKLLLEHERTRPIGTLKSYEITDQGVEAVFHVAKTSAGEDALVEASTGLRDGFSVGVKVDAWNNNDGVMHITAAKLIEVSLVTDPAIASAKVSTVAASENTEEVPTEEVPLTEGEGLVSETVSEATVTEAVEASKPEVTAAVVTAPVAYSKPRVNTDVTAGQYAMAQIQASRGDADARDLVAALQVATVAENTGMVPPTYLRDVIGVIDSSRPFVSSIETAVTFQEDSVVKFAGAGKIDVELLDRSDPSFLDLYLRELAASYAQKTDAYAAQIAAQNATQSSAATIYAAIAKGIADSYGVMRMTPNRLLVANTGGEDGIDFAGLLGAVDSTGRPIYAAAAPQNANGLVTQGSTAGTVAGLGLVVDANYTGDDANAKHALVYPSNAMRFHEGSRIELRANVVANGQVEIGLYGYVAVVNRYPAAFRKLNVA